MKSIHEQIMKLETDGFKDVEKTAKQINRKDNHRIFNGKVCCIGHCCNYHDMDEKDFSAKKVQK